MIFSPFPMTGSPRVRHAVLGVERRWWRVLGATLVLTAMAKGGAYLPGYSFDDYGLVNQEAPASFLYSQGRFGAAALLGALRELQVEPRSARVVFVSLSMLAVAAVGTLVARHWRVSGRWQPVAVAALVANHPFTVEIFTFRTALAAFAVPMLAFALLLVPRRWSYPQLLGGTVLFAAALSVYQVVLHYAGMVLVGGLMVDAARALAAKAPRLPWIPRDLRHRRTGLLVCVLLGSVLYALTTLAAVRLAGAPAETLAWLSPGDVDERVAAIVGTLRYRFAGTNPLTGQTVVRLQQALLALAFSGILWRVAAASGRRARAAALGLAAVGLLAAGLLWSVGAAALAAVWWPTPRVMAHSGVLVAAVAAASQRSLAGRARTLAAALAALLLFCYLGINNQVLQDQWRLNLRDLLKARTIMARLEEQPGFPQADQLALDGGYMVYPRSLATRDMDMNVTAFGPWYSAVWALIESSGYDLRAADDRGVAGRFCAGRPIWPAEGSVGVEGRVAIVCLGDRAQPSAPASRATPNPVSP